MSDNLKPMRVNMPRVFALGALLWLAGTVVVALWLALGEGARPGWLGIGLTGTAIGVAGVFWARKRRW